MSILAIYDSTGFLQTKGAPLLGEAPIIGRLPYVSISSSIGDSPIVTHPNTMYP